MILTREYSPELTASVDALRERILTDPVGVLDPPNQHHQFASKVNHGRKLDFDKIEEETDFYDQWTTTYAQWIAEMYPGDERPDALLGVANGANRLARTIAPSLGILGLETLKVDSKTVTLDSVARLAIQETAPDFVLVIEDVGTTGGTTSTAVADLEKLGVAKIEVAHTWIRNPELKKLEEIGLTYSAVIHEPLPTFSEDDCRNLAEGFCNQRVLLIPHAT